MFVLYVRLGRKAQNYLITATGYIFYGLWSIKFLSLLWISTLVDYIAGRLIEAAGDNEKKRKRYLIMSMTINLGMLCYFKYMGFFVAQLSELFGISIDYNGLFANVVLPAGISFYTFQSMSYVIDVYRRQIPAEKSLIDFSAFVGYFPHLVAGPIQRAETLLFQITHDRVLTLCFPLHRIIA